MSNVLHISVHFLDPAPVFHGQRDDDEPEWPPSPLRLFQSLVDAATSRGYDPKFAEYVKPALEWLQRLQPSQIIAPSHHVGIPFRIAVPNNDLDIWAEPISKGRFPKKQPNELKTMKTIQPTRIRVGCDESDNAIHYVYCLSDGECLHLDAIVLAARSITHLGWGIDMAVGDANIITNEQAAQLPGQRWKPSPIGGTRLRTPKTGTLDDLTRKHEAFLNRLSGDGFKPVPPLSAFRVIGYRRDTDPPTRPATAFSILKLDASGYRAFNTACHATVVAGMVRHALGDVAKVQRPFGWNDEDIARIVLGHDANGRAVSDDPAEPRFSYLPLPTIEFRGSNNARHVGAIRRVLISGTPGMERELAWVRRALSGSELIREGADESDALLSTIPSNNFVVDQYLKTASIWTTVTPVILPGHDDRRQNKTERLLRKAMRQAGYAEELVQHAEIAWRSVGFLSGADLASRYRRPRNVSEAPVCHVRIQWRDSQGKPLSIAGPHAIGSGRFRGLGLMAAVE